MRACRAECEDRLRAEFRIEMNAAVAESEQRWQSKEQELQALISELRGQLSEVSLPLTSCPPEPGGGRRSRAVDPRLVG